MSNFLTDYITYMRQLAAEHTALHHTTDKKHFFRGELEEFWEQFRSEANFPCLVTEKSEIEYSGEIMHMTKRRITSFLVIDHYDQFDDYDDILLKMSNCEKIAEEIMGRMMTDEEAPFYSIDTESIHGEYLDNSQERYVGYVMAFSSTEQACFFSTSAWSQPTTEEEVSDEAD